MLQCVAMCCSALRSFSHEIHHFVPSHSVCCSELRCVAVCCSVCCSVLQCAAVLCTCDTSLCTSHSQRGVPCVAVYCRVLQCVAMCCSVLRCVAVCCIVLQRVAACCSVSQCVAMCRSVLQCVAACCSALQTFLHTTHHYVPFSLKGGARARVNFRQDSIASSLFFTCMYTYRDIHVYMCVYRYRDSIDIKIYVPANVARVHENSLSKDLSKCS